MSANQPRQVVDLYYRSVSTRGFILYLHIPTCCLGTGMLPCLYSIQTVLSRDDWEDGRVVIYKIGEYADLTFKLEIIIVSFTRV